MEKIKAEEFPEEGASEKEDDESSLSTEAYLSEDDYSDAGSDDSTSTMDSDDQEIVDIEKLMRVANEKARERLRNVVASSSERMKAQPMFNPAAWAYRKVKGYYNRWYEKEREKRLHPVYRHYAKRAMELDKKLKADFLSELEKQEAEVVQQAKLRQKRIKRSGMVKNRGEEALARFDGEVIRRNEEARRQEFNCINMQKWAGDNYDRDMALAAEAKLAGERADAKAKDDDVKAEIARDKGIVAEDTALTQELYRQMRVSGLKEGVNVKLKADAKRKKKPKPSRQTNSIIICLKADTAHKFKEWEPKYEVSKRTREGNIFDHDLTRYKFLKKVRCSKIGEKGALCLAADFIRGACPQLKELDMSYCQIQTRGLQRVLQGIKVANISSLVRFNVRGNDIGPRGVQTLSAMLNLTIFENLSYIDLRDNELGDRGADHIIHMCVFGLLENIVELDLGSNMISDQGYVALVNVFAASQIEKCPQLVKLGLSNNFVKPETKRSLDPFPIFIQP